MTSAVLTIVEDDADLLAVWKELFELSDYRVHAFDSAGAALADEAALHETRLLITDFHLAEHNGIELIRAVRRIQPGLPAVLLTGLGQHHIGDLLAQESDIALFFKPVSVQVIETHVAKVMGQAVPDSLPL